VQRIALNVLPIEQVEKTFDAVPFFGTNTPGQSYTLRRGDGDPSRKPALMFPIDDSFSALLSDGGSTLLPWTRIEDLDDAAPDAAVYALDERTSTLSFGNGINGRQPVQGATLRVDYNMTSGARGNLPRGIQWTVAGVAGPFGVNSEVTSGGSDATDLAALRTSARQRVQRTRPIVTTTDLREATLAFADLDVRRAEELPAATGASRVSGRRVLVAVGPHDGGADAGAFEESALWLNEIRRRLRPRLPLGQGLDVIGPRLVDIRVVAHLVAAPQIDPDALRAAIQRVLRARLAITATDAADVWPFGRDVTSLTVKGWLRNVDGVARVVSAALISPPSTDGRDRIELGAAALPRLQIEPGDLTIDRAPVGGRA
jgi:predicted phage baseplate assembly protein